MKWGYRRRTGWQLGKRCYGYEKRGYRFSFSIPVVWPCIWTDRDEPLAPALKLDPEAFERRQRMTAPSS